jgi:hypothetical protein
MTNSLADELAVVLAYWKRKYEVVAADYNLIEHTANLLRLATRGQVLMTHEDLGMEIVGGRLKPEAHSRMMDHSVVPTDDDWDFDVGWVEGIPHCEACGRFCLHMHMTFDEGPITDKDRLLVCSVPGMPISVARCPDCFDSDVWPYGLLVSQAACIVDVTKKSWTENFAPFFLTMIDVTLSATGRTWQQFMRDVKQDVEAMDAYMAQPREDSVNISEPYYDLAGPPKEFKPLEEGPVVFSLNGADFEEGYLTKGCPVCTLSTKTHTWLCERADCPYLGRGEG